VFRGLEPMPARCLAVEQDGFLLAGHRKRPVRSRMPHTN
jgi:hypothetical protein